MFKALIYAVHAQLFDECCARFLKYVSGLVFYGLPDLSLPFALERHILDLHMIGVLRKADFVGKAGGEMNRPSNFTFDNEESFMSIVHGRKIAVIYNFESLPVLTSSGPIFVSDVLQEELRQFLISFKVTEPSIDFSRQHVQFLDGNHFTTCQFQTKNDENYKKLCQLVLKALDNRQSDLLRIQNRPSSDPFQPQNLPEQEYQFSSGTETDNSTPDYAYRFS